MLLKQVYMGHLKLVNSFSVEHFFISVAIFTQVASVPLNHSDAKDLFLTSFSEIEYSFVGRVFMLTVDFLIMSYGLMQTDLLSIFFKDVKQDILFFSFLIFCPATTCFSTPNCCRKR